MLKGLIHSIETFGSVDGPGIRFVVFLQGCNMRCRYCHNVDTWKYESTNLKTADEILDKAENYREYWGKDGGITVSGGEPLLQIDFLIELFRKAKERKINTCLDTSGEPFTKEEPFFEKFKVLLSYTDLILLDLKHIDNEEHIKLTSKPNENILDCFKFLSKVNKPIWIRHVLVPGLTDDDVYLRQTRKFIETLSNVEKIEVLPYHNMGEFKWEKLGIPYTLKETSFPTRERVKNAMDILNGITK